MDRNYYGALVDGIVYLYTATYLHYTFLFLQKILVKKCIQIV